MRAYVSQLICHFGRIWWFSFSPFAPYGVLAVFRARRVLGPSVPKNMGPSVPKNVGPSVPSFHGIKVIIFFQHSNLSVVYFIDIEITLI